MALQGFGDRGNSLAWSMAWFNNHLLVGTGRETGCFTALPYPPTGPNLSCPPTKAQLFPTMGAQIWSLNPVSTQPLTQTNWSEVYSSPVTVPMTISNTPILGPRDWGYRGMSIWTNSQGRPSVYTGGEGFANLAGNNVLPPSLLNTYDGVHFAPVPADPGTTLGNINVLTTTYNADPCCFRGSQTYNGHFYTTIVDGSGFGSLFASPHPYWGNNTFVQITPQSMPVYEFQTFNGHMYIGSTTNNLYTVWRTDCTAPPTGQLWCPQSAFTEIVPPGGGLANDSSVAVVSMHVYTDTVGVPHLYVGTASGLAVKGQPLPNPGPAELIRINTDDSWDLIAGTPRTVDGVSKAPLSGWPAGFGWFYNFHMYRMGDYNGTLYVGTYNDATRLLISPAQQQQYQQCTGGNLWASDDGIHFYPITQNAFGDRWSDSIRSIQATPYGLFIGSNNEFYGLRLWQAVGTSAAQQLAPTNQPGQSGGTPDTSSQTCILKSLRHVERGSPSNTTAALVPTSLR